MFTFPVLTICLLTKEDSNWFHEDGTPATQKEIEEFLLQNPGELDL